MLTTRHVCLIYMTASWHQDTAGEAAGGSLGDIPLWKQHCPECSSLFQQVNVACHAEKLVQESFEEHNTEDQHNIQQVVRLFWLIGISHYCLAAQKQKST